MVAKAVAELGKNNPQTPDDIVEGLAKCEIVVNQIVTMTIHNECLLEDFEDYYGHYFEELVDKMIAKGYKYDAKEKKFY